VLGLRLGEGTPLASILCVGAHCDDIEIGCGGSLLKWAKAGRFESVTWVVFTSDPRRKQEAIRSAETLLRGVKKTEIVVHSFRDGFLPAHWTEVKDRFEQIKASGAPDAVFTHHRADLHQDHRLISELTWNTFRDHLILEYEIPKYDGDLGAPNAFMELDETETAAKIAHLLETFESQKGKRWFAEDLFRATMRIRGMECNAASGFAEAFYCRKALLR
jgi:LmbE family N-acetylglucosaminyl deacetylase